MRRSAVPASILKIDVTLQHQPHGSAFSDRETGLCRPVFKPFYGGDFQRSGWRPDVGSSAGMEKVTALHAHPRVTIQRRIEPAIGSSQMDSRFHRAAGVIGNFNADAVHWRLPLPRLNVDDLLAPAVSVHHYQSWKTTLIGDVRNALAIGRPARVKIIVLAKRQLVRRTAFNWKHIQVIELVRSTAGGRVKES